MYVFLGRLPEHITQLAYDELMEVKVWVSGFLSHCRMLPSTAAHGCCLQETFGVPVERREMEPERKDGGPVQEMVSPAPVTRPRRSSPTVFDATINDSV